MYFRFYYYMYGSNIGQLSIWKMNNCLIVMYFRFYYYMYGGNIRQLSIWKMNNHCNCNVFQVLLLHVWWKHQTAVYLEDE